MVTIILTVVTPATDWVNFQPNSAGITPATLPYSDGETPTSLLIDLQTGVVPGTGTYSFVGLSSTGNGTLVSIENVLGSIGDDVINGSSDENDLRGGAGDDLIYGKDGNDRLVGGAGYDELFGGTGNDVLFGGGGSFSRINASLIGNEVTGGDGADTFMVGYSLADELLNSAPVASILDLTTTSNVPGSDLILDWDSSADSIFVSANGVAIISGLYGQATVSPSGQADWTGNDIVDLRSRVANDGVIVVMAGAGDDTIYGSVGVDYIYGNSGRNTIDVSNGGADHIYIDTMVGAYDVRGFSSDDKIYINRDALSPFLQPGFTFTGSEVNDDRAGASVTAGAGRSASGLGLSFSGIYDPVYDQFLSNNVPSYPSMSGTFGFAGLTFGSSDAAWQSNGVYSNDAHKFAQQAANTSLTAAGGTMIGVGYALGFIPIVGPLIAIAPLTIGGAILDLGILGGGGSNIDSTAHQNAEYRNDSLNGYFNFVGTGQNVSSTVGAWEELSFSSFYQNANDGFSPALQVRDQVNRSDLPASPLAISTLVAVYGSNETFIYLVSSADNIIQNGEARLIAQINGQVSASQIVMYDPSTDIYNNVDGALPILPPSATSSLNVAVGKNQFAGAGGFVTDDQSPVISITLGGLLTSSDPTSVRIYNGETLIQSFTTTPGQILTFSGSLSVESTTAYRVVVSSSQGFSSESSFTIRHDLKAPVVSGLSASADGIYVTSDESGYAAIYKPDGALIGSEQSIQAFSSTALVPVFAQSSVSTVTLKVADLFGLGNFDHTKVVVGLEGDPSSGVPNIPVDVKLGTNGADTISVAASAVTYLGSSIPTLGIAYGFGGDDTITGDSNTDYLFGGDGADVLYGMAGNDYLYAGNGADVIVGGLGADTIFLDETAAAADRVIIGRGASAAPVAVGDSTPSIDASTTAIPRLSVSGFDIVDGFDVVLDKVEVIGAVLASDTVTAVNGVDYGGDNAVIKSHRIVNGVVEFDDQDANLASFQALSIYSEEYNAGETSTYNLDEVIGYLRLNLLDDETVVFNSGQDMFVYTQAGSTPDNPATSGVNEAEYRAESLINIADFNASTLTLEAGTGFLLFA